MLHVRRLASCKGQKTDMFEDLCAVECRKLTCLKIGVL